MITANYPCSQQELYMVCRLGWQSCEENLAAFTDFKTTYDAALITTRRTEVEAAAGLPDFQTRDSISEGFRVELKTLARKCLANWQRLKRHIADAWPAEQQKNKTEAAGQNYYEKAGNFEWDACRGLLASGLSFIDDNMATLTAAGMPAGFQPVFKNDKILFENKQQEFLNSVETGKIETETKGKANNDIYAKVINMFLDGQEIFKNEDAVKDQFVFDQVLGVVSGTDAAGFKGVIKDSVTGLPVAGAVLTVKGSAKTATSDADGRYKITGLAAGEYQVTVGAEGYVGQEINQVVKVGTESNLDISMVLV